MLRVTVGFFHYHSIKIRKLDRQIKYILIEDDDRKPHTKHLYMVPCTWKSRREEKWVKLSPKTTTDSRSKTGRSYENTKRLFSVKMFIVNRKSNGLRNKCHWKKFMSWKVICISESKTISKRVEPLKNCWRTRTSENRLGN